MHRPLTDDELEEIEQRAERATPGPWEAGVRYERFGVNEGVRPGEGPFSFLPVGRCYQCAQSGEAPVALERDRFGAVYHVHRVVTDAARPASRWRTISSAATRELVVESYEGMISAGIQPRDARFISHARTDVPRLVAEVKRLRAALAALDGLRQSTEAVQRTTAALREEAQRLRVERDETLAAMRRTRGELQAVGRFSAGPNGARRGSN
ncbi:MAG TPA: hypothetical protein VGR37_17800 [Longimicrobiaceae bacterium]|nr:hypothetical protein [Longimicrobiaceae bacterium]